MAQRRLYTGLLAAISAAVAGLATLTGIYSCNIKTISVAEAED